MLADDKGVHKGVNLGVARGTVQGADAFDFQRGLSVDCFGFGRSSPLRGRAAGKAQ